MCASIGEEFAHAVYFVTRYRGDIIEVIAKAVPAPYTPDTPATHVALATWPYRTVKNRTQVEFTLAFDLWLQFDGGGATAAKRGPTYGWSGRVEVPRRRREA
jgi:hypothetical protein